MDSSGTELTEGQKEYFKDSKVVDDNGNLMVMYHGTDAYEEFNMFKKGKFGYLSGGIHLTNSEVYANRYADQFLIFSKEKSTNNVSHVGERFDERFGTDRQTYRHRHEEERADGNDENNRETSSSEEGFEILGDSSRSKQGGYNRDHIYNSLTESAGIDDATYLDSGYTDRGVFEVYLNC